MPSIQTPYYSMTLANTFKTLDRIEWTDPRLKNTDEFVSYTGYSSTGDNTQIQSSIATSAMDCQTQCTKDPQCNYVYYSNNANKNNTNCQIGKNNIPKFIPNNNSTLYIRKKKMDIEKSINQIKPDFENKNTSLQYSTYNIRTDTSNDKFGYAASLQWQQASKILGAVVNGTGTGNKPEGFDNYGYNDPSVDCNSGSYDGCNKAINTKQIVPLQKIAQDYQGQIAQMGTNQTNLQNTIDEYNATRSILNSNEKYDFNGYQPFNMEDTSIQNAMQQDTKQLLLKENDFYIAGSILTTTLLIGAIYLAR
jgi:hypothetical protein